MAQDETLAHRVRAALAGHAGISEKRMMGGLCFFLNGNMLGGVRRDTDGTGRFMFRVGKDREAQALRDPAARPVVLGQRRMGGFVHVDASDCPDDALARWLAMTLEHAASLPAKD